MDTLLLDSRHVSEQKVGDVGKKFLFCKDYF